jgi:glycolate oxidase iron-sulfur subunit
MPPVMWTGLKVANHAPCSLQHGQRIDTLPVQILNQAGYAVAAIPEGHLC